MREYLPIRLNDQPTVRHCEPALRLDNDIQSVPRHCALELILSSKLMLAFVTSEVSTQMHELEYYAVREATI